MSGVERERKFLVCRGVSWRRYVFSSSPICQGYIPAEGATVRVRRRGERGYLTIKGPSTSEGLVRYEFEKEITLAEASSLLALCCGGSVEKTRYKLRYADCIYEVDIFRGANAGLVLGEIEHRGDVEAPVPPFFGREVSADPHFRNAYIAQHPFGEWRDIVPEEYIAAAADPW